MRRIGVGVALALALAGCGTEAEGLPRLQPERQVSSREYARVLDRALATVDDSFRGIGSAADVDGLRRIAAIASERVDEASALLERARDDLSLLGRKTGGTEVDDDVARARALTDEALAAAAEADDALAEARTDVEDALAAARAASSALADALEAAVLADAIVGIVVAHLRQGREDGGSAAPLAVAARAGSELARAETVLERAKRLGEALVVALEDLPQTTAVTHVRDAAEATVEARQQVSEAETILLGSRAAGVSPQLDDAVAAVERATDAVDEADLAPLPDAAAAKVEEASELLAGAASTLGGATDVAQLEDALAALERARSRLHEAALAADVLRVVVLEAQLEAARETLADLEYRLVSVQPPSSKDRLHWMTVTAVRQLQEDVEQLRGLLEALRSGQVDGIHRLTELLAGVGLRGAIQLREALYREQEDAFTKVP